MDEASDWSTQTARRRRGPPALALLALLLVAFAGGIVLAGYLVKTSPRVAGLLKVSATSAAPAALQMPAAPAALTAPGDAAIGERLDALEGQIDQVAQRTATASGNADRAEGLLVAFAARRALDRGMALGYIEGLLRERFGGTDPQAVAAVIAAARQPITLDELDNGLETLRPMLSAAVPGDGWFANLKHELGALIVIRPADQPSAVPSDRVQRALRQLEAGQVDRAMTEIGRLPGRGAADDWMAKARRYVQARNALDRIETAALLRPHAAPPAASDEPALAVPAAG